VRAKALATTPAQWHIHIHAGMNQRDVYYVGPMLDAMVGTTGATAHRDGAFANGVWWIPEGRGPNVEAYERDWPVLYLYRREDPDSGGAGRSRGGNGGRLAYVQHNGDMAVGLYTSEGIPKAPGIFGATPGSPGLTRLIDGSDVREQFQAGKLPGALEELSGEEVTCYGKGNPLMVQDASVIEYNWGGSAGYGDPLLRDPERVFGDVAAGVVSAEDAEHQYGVVVRDGRLDEQGTEQRRDELRRKRFAAAGLDGEPRPRDASPPDGATLIGEDIWVDHDAGAYRCAHCGEEIGALSSHTKEKLGVWEHPVEEIGKEFRDPGIYVDDTIVWREFVCPGCATRLATEICRPDDEVLAEIRLSL
jgi:N-methylhydantoinase B